MSITNSSGTITEAAPIDADQFTRTGTIREDQFAVCGATDRLKQMKFSVAGATTGKTATIAFAGAADATFTLPAATSTLVSAISVVDQTLQYSAPAAAATVTVAVNTRVLALKPAGTIATLTVTLPVTPNDGHTVQIMCSQIVTTLTLDAGAASVVGAALSAFTAGGFATYCYRVADTTWYRVG
jgi:hypothetical protein